MKKDMKAIKKRKKLIPVKKYKVKVMEKPKSNNTNVQPCTTVSKAPTNLENQTPSQEGTLKNNPPLENIPVHVGTPWPEAGKMSGNLFELRKDWSIPPNNNNNATATATPNPHKDRAQAQEQPTPSSVVALKSEKCGWGPNCPICKKLEEDWDGDHQKQFQQPQQPQAQCPQTQNYQKLQSFQRSKSQTFDIPDRYSSQLKLRRQWEKMERLNNKYGLDCFLDSEFDSESDEGEEYKYEHNYKTLL